MYVWKFSTKLILTNKILRVMNEILFFKFITAKCMFRNINVENPFMRFFAS